jgi:hypothetical protein
MSLFKKPKEEVVGGATVTGKVRASTTIKARVLDSDGNVIEDLGVIVGKRTKEEGDRTRAALARLAKNYKGGK